MRKLICVFGLLLLGLSLWADTFRDVEYIHQSERGKGERESGELVIDSAARQIAFKGPNGDVDIPAGRITHMLYERASKPRYAAGMLLAWPLLFTKSKQHFLTVEYKAEGDQGKYAMFRLSKDNYREVLASAEAATGQKVERQEEK